MKSFGWPLRARLAGIAGLSAWLAGFLATIPFEAAVAWRYVNGRIALLPWTLAEGLTVWAAFTFLMAVAAWIPIVLPIALLLPPAWIVRARLIFIPGSVAASFLALAFRLHLFQRENFVSLAVFLDMFVSAEMTFVCIFGLVLAVVYTTLAARRIKPLG